ncbi:MAG: hypothetical protein Q8M88_14100 [Phenylobacterium sp.]|uniref:DUF3617 domain-containing protein n=1 Tax=Phenylobacterium sp. TaxID=1871053 RepID=UPI00273576EB|nr:DUF3617 family protein [Phenylobacterium sp.]MDP3175560.1 hypothetical protein [Phenylobacterium sp.]
MNRRLACLAAGAAMVALSGCGDKSAGDKAAPAKTGTPSDASATASGPSVAMTPPHRKPGLWEQKVSMSGMDQTTRLCLDEAVEQKLSWWGQQATKDMCAKTRIAPRLDGAWEIASECDMGSGGKTVTNGVAVGDFATGYRMEATTVTTGAGAPQMNGEHKMVVQATWKGACPAGFKPGDMELPGGMKFNMIDMAGKTRSAG